MTVTPGTRTAALASGALFEQVPALTDLDPADPYPAYSRLFGPPVEVAGGDVVILTRFADCAEMMRHPDVTLRRKDSAAFRGLSSSFLNVLDPPEHTRIRRLVNKAFSARSVELLRPWLEDQVHLLLDRTAGQQTIDVIESLAYPLPLFAICELLDIPVADRHAVMGWSRPITFGVDLLAGRRPREDQVRYRSSLRQFRLYINELAAQRRRSPGDDLLTRLISTDDAGDRLTEREVTATAIGLLITGHETTVSLIGHGAIALAQHPKLRGPVAADESAADAFVEEILRYDSPVQATLRVAARDLTVGGVDVQAGTALLLLLGAANRDPEQFADPDRLAVDRPNNRTHLAFGGGAHFCLGASLGRLEAKIALAALAARLVNPRARLDGVRYDKSVMLRTQTRLEIDVDGLLPRRAPGSR